MTFPLAHILVDMSDLDLMGSRAGTFEALATAALAVAITIGAILPIIGYLNERGNKR